MSKPSNHLHHILPLQFYILTPLVCFQPQSQFLSLQQVSSHNPNKQQQPKVSVGSELFSTVCWVVYIQCPDLEVRQKSFKLQAA